ncbi:UNVERIFIED_CONTAM: hypothetical protein NCL1_20304 [Trichonephila clavipes]
MHGIRCDCDFVQKESDPVDDETDEDEDNNNNESSKSPSNAEAFSVLEKTIEWYEQQSEYFSTQLLQLKRIRDLAAKKRRHIRRIKRTPSFTKKLEMFECSSLIF